PIGIGLLLLLIFHSLVALAQTNVRVSGTVMSDAGEELSGVSIRTIDGSASTSTDNAGRFTIEVPANSVLLFSFIGYTTQEIQVAQANRELTVTLEATAGTLDEVVVVGYGTQRREAVTGSVASISGDVMREVQSANFSQALQGRLPGVELTQTSSQPG